MQYWNGLIHAKNLITSGWINDTDYQYEYEGVTDITFPKLWDIGDHISSLMNIKVINKPKFFFAQVPLVSLSSLDYQQKNFYMWQSNVLGVITYAVHLVVILISQFGDSTSIAKLMHTKANYSHMYYEYQ